MKFNKWFVGLAGLLFFVGTGALFTSDVATFSKVVIPSTTLTTPSPIINSSLSSKSISRISIPSDMVVHLKGEVDSNTYSVVEELKDKAKRHKELYLLIDSPGGSVLDGALLISAMEASQAKINTVCMSLCASMAFIVLEKGAQRYAVDRAILMAHPASGQLAGTMEQMQSRLGTISRFVDKMNTSIATRLGLTLDQFKSQYISELWVDSEDALERKLLDGIIDVSLEGHQHSLQLFPTQEHNSNSKKSTTPKESINLTW